MSDTLILAPTLVRHPSLEQVTTPMPQRSFVEALDGTAPDVEVVEAVKLPASVSLLELINSMLAKDTTSREELLALRARLRRYSSEVNVLASLIRSLLRRGS